MHYIARDNVKETRTERDRWRRRVGDDSLAFGDLEKVLVYDVGLINRSR